MTISLHNLSGGYHDSNIPRRLLALIARQGLSVKVTIWSERRQILKRWLVVVLIVTLCVAIVGCGAPAEPGETTRPEWVTPLVDLQGTPDGRLEIRLGVVNETQREFAEDEAFDGRWQLVDAGGVVRAEGRLYHLGPLDADEARYPMSWTGEVESAAYRLLWGAPTIGSVVAEFQVTEDNGDVNVDRLTVQPADSYPPGEGYID